jgi:hypothetical protein
MEKQIVTILMQALSLVMYIIVPQYIPEKSTTMTLTSDTIQENTIMPENLQDYTYTYLCSTSTTPAIVDTIIIIYFKHESMLIGDVSCDRYYMPRLRSNSAGLFIHETTEGLFWSIGTFRVYDGAYVRKPIVIGKRWISGMDAQATITDIGQVAFGGRNIKTVTVRIASGNTCEVYTWGFGVGLLSFTIGACDRGEPTERITLYSMEKRRL